MPAQLTSPSTRLYSASAAATAAFALASSVTSVRTNLALGPSSFASACPTASFKSAMMAFPPPAITIRTVAAPHPEAPPVTMNVLSFNCIFVALSLGLLEDGQGGRDETCQVAKVRRQDHRVARLRDVGERCDVLLGDLEVHGLQPAGRLDRLGHLPDRLGV